MFTENVIKALLEFAKYISFRRGVMLFCAGIIVLLLWKTDPAKIIEQYATPQPAAQKKEYVVTPDGYSDSPSVKKLISGIKDSDVHFIAVYKFLPSSNNVYEYQGRMIVASSTDMEQLNELGIIWIPITSSYNVMEVVLSGQSTVSTLNGTEYMMGDIIDDNRMINKDYLRHQKINMIYRFPIKRKSEVIGYVLIYAYRPLDKSVIESVDKLAARLGVYL